MANLNAQSKPIQYQMSRDRFTIRASADIDYINITTSVQDAPSFPSGTILIPHELIPMTIRFLEELYNAHDVITI